MAEVMPFLITIKISFSKPQKKKKKKSLKIYKVIKNNVKIKIKCF